MHLNRVVREPEMCIARMRFVRHRCGVFELRGRDARHVDGRPNSDSATDRYYYFSNAWWCDCCVVRSRIAWHLWVGFEVR